MTIIRDGTCTVFVDTQYWPVVFSTWFGEATEEAVRSHQQATDKVLARARKGRERYIIVSDAAFAERPNAKVRKALADQTKTRPSDARDFELANLVVIESSIIRGAVTALAWLAPQMIQDLEIVSGIDAAIDRVLQVLDQHGIARPPGLTRTLYKRPTPDAPVRARQR